METKPAKHEISLDGGITWREVTEEEAKAFTEEQDFGPPQLRFYQNDEDIANNTVTCIVTQYPKALNN